jgi:Domain of unknown function (DUF4331)
MSDHISGPRAIADPVSDITDTYAFPSPESPRNLVMIMNVFPFAGPSALFSDAVIHRFRIRPAAIDSTGRAFAVGTEECMFDFVFAVPVSRDSEPTVQLGRCIAPNGENISFRVNDEKGGGREGLRVFAGQRADQFFFDGGAAQKTVDTRKLAFKKVGTYLLADQNVLAIVLSIDWAAFLNGGPMFAVVYETLASGKRPVRLERVGRPEIKNVTLGFSVFDQINRDLEIRDLYNNEDAFNLSKEYIRTYRARMNANLAFYDGLDDKIDWPADEHGNHPLCELLLQDFLVVDVSKPFTDTSYLEIEQAMLKGRAHATSGGRWLDDDVIDIIYTTYINGGNGPRISDGVDAPHTLSSKVFPYMPPPHPPKVEPGLRESALPL